MSAATVRGPGKGGGSRVAAVEGLRAIAALSVLGYHVALFTGHTQHDAVASQLKAGVAVFFVISGFVLYRPYAAAIRSGGRLPDPRTFMRRRAARILPAYWVVLTAWLVINVLSAPHNGAFGPSGDWWRYYALTQTYSSHPPQAGLGVAWSLCVEVAFYLLLPALAYCFARLSDRARRRGRWSPGAVQLVGVALLALCSFELRVSLTGGSLLSAVATSRQVAASSLPLLFDWFALGIALAVFAAEWELAPERFAAVGRLAGRPARCWLAAGLLFGVAVPIQGGDVLLPLDSAAAHLALGLGSALLVLPVVAPAATRSRRSRLLSWLASPQMVWLGMISYGIYLVHVPALFELRALLFGIPAYPPRVVPAGLAPTAGLLLATLAGAICLAAMSWYLIERPAQRRWGSRKVVGATSPEQAGLVGVNRPIELAQRQFGLKSVYRRLR